MISKEIIAERQRIVLRNAGGKMTVKEFCDEHIKRGWANDTFTPEYMGLEDDDTIALTDPLQNIN